jgi:hypothetical protein
MLLIIAFGIYAIVKKKVHITNKWTLTGANARNFGIGVVVMTLPVAVVAPMLLSAVLPHAWVYNPIGGRLLVLAVLGVALFLLALGFEDETPAPRRNW